jgi:gluconokinase
MGVTGSGKSTVGATLAARLGCAFYDGDDYHPAANVEKMRRGEPLNDVDRAPWLDRLRGLLTEKLRSGESAVLACSALRESYRERLRPGAPGLRNSVYFVYLRISEETARARLTARTGHFMPVGLVESQFATLEDPRDAIEIDAMLPPDELAQRIEESLSRIKISQ